MIGVDTNVLVHAIDSRSPNHERCLQIMLGADPDSERGIALPWSVIYEFIRLVTHPRTFPQPISTIQAWEIVERLLASSHVRTMSAGPGHPAAAARMLAAPGIRGNLVHDAHIAAVLAEHGVRRIYTFDQDFRRFPGVEVVDPLG